MRDRLSPRLIVRGFPPRLAILASLLLCSAVLLAHHPLAADVTERVSVATDGTQGDAESRTAAISADGRFVTFESDAITLVASDTNGCLDVFVRDRLTGQTERVSVASDGTQGDAASWAGNISADGRYVAFSSFAANLVPLDDNGVFDVFVHDRQTGQTERVSLATDGTQGNGNSLMPAISSDGRYVAFESDATTLVSGDTNGKTDVFVHDRHTGDTERVSVASDGTQGDGNSWHAATSADGRYVGFHSYSDALVAGDTNGKVDVFIHDRLTNQTQRVSVASDGTQGDGNSECPSISADGRYVAFASYATTLVPFDTNDIWDVFVHDRHTGQTQRVSVTSSGAQVNHTSRYPSISADGRYVAFQSAADEYVTDSNNSIDIFLHDRQTAQTQRLSITSGGAEANGDSDYPAISADGRCVAFTSAAPDLVSGDTNGVRDVFVRTRPAADFAATPTSGYAPLSVDFTDLSTGSPTAWEWHFGDGATSTAQHPTHEYLSAGSYTVTLTVYGAGSSDTKTTPDYIVVNPEPLADFSASPTTGMAPLTVYFTDLSAGELTSWDWDFGDGGSSALQHPSHEYLVAGLYTVSLTVSDGVTSDTATKTGYITVAPAPPVADFSATPTSGPAPLEVAFTDLSTNVPTSWSWDFGDGGTSTEQNPTYTYSAAGLYTVSISAANEAGYDCETKTDYVAVLFPDVELDDWACDAVLACIDAGIVSGYDDGLYHPEWAVTRDQMAVYIARAISPATGPGSLAEYTPPATPSFSDVPTDFWCYTYIEYAAASNVIGGYADQTYHPEYVLDRGQMAVFIARAIVDPFGEEGLLSYQPPDTPTFPDVLNTGYGDDGADPFWAYKHIEYIAGEGVCGGYGDGLYHPEYVCTRDQMAVYIARAFNLM